MSTQQPNWKIIGHVGDMDPIAYGGGFIYEDTTGVYTHEMSYFVPGTDEEWKDKRDATPLKVHRILLERDSKSEWWYENLPQLAGFMGYTINDLRSMADGSDIREKALLYMALIEYHGAVNFDDQPQEMTEDEAYSKFDAEMKFIHQSEDDSCPTT